MKKIYNRIKTYKKKVKALRVFLINISIKITIFINKMIIRIEMQKVQQINRKTKRQKKPKPRDNQERKKLK